MLSLFFSYLKFLWQSTNQHGVHSPFVFDFVTKGLYKKHDSNTIKKIKLIRKTLLKNNKKIEIEDFGAGSKIFKTNKRTISQLTKHVALSNKKAEILFKTTNYFKPKTILELGTSLGLGTITLAISNLESKIISVEGCKNIFNEAENVLKENNIKNCLLKNSNFDDFLKSYHQDYECVLFDGNHTYDATISYFNQLLIKKHNDSYWIFDDIHWSKDMERAWLYIKNHDEVSVTIDLFHYGLVFFRKEQMKQNFVIRA